MAWLSEASLRIKILVVVGLLGLLNLGGAGYLVREWRGDNGAYEEMVGREVEVAGHALTIRGDIQNVARNINNIRLLDNDPAALPPLEARINGLLAEIERRAGLMEQTGQGLATQMVADTRQTVTRIRQVVGQIYTVKRDSAPGHSEAIDTLWNSPDGRVAVDGLYERIAAFAQSMRDKVRSESATMSSEGQRTAMVVLGSIVLLLLAVAIGVVAFIQRSVVRPITELEAAMARIRDGDDTTAVAGTTRKDEVGRMAASLLRLRDGLAGGRQAREAQEEAAKAQIERTSASMRWCGASRQRQRRCWARSVPRQRSWMRRRAKWAAPPNKAHPRPPPWPRRPSRPAPMCRRSLPPPRKWPPPSPRSPARWPKARASPIRRRMKPAPRTTRWPASPPVPRRSATWCG